MSSQRFTSLFCIMLVLNSTGCTTWSLVEFPGPRALDPAPSARYLVTTKSGPSWALSEVRIRNDSLVGNRVDGAYPREVAVPVGEIRRVEAPKVDVGGIVGIVAGLAFVLGTVGSNMNFGP